MADTFKGIITADGKKRQLPYANVLEAPVSDKTLSEDGGFADAKVTGDNFAKAKTETDSLKEDISTKITKFYASNLGETHLADSDNGKIQDMMIYGKSSQDGTPTPENPVEIKSIVNPTVKVVGKNLWSGKNTERYWMGNNETVNSDCISSDYIPIKGSQTVYAGFSYDWFVGFNCYDSKKNKILGCEQRLNNTQENIEKEYRIIPSNAKTPENTAFIKFMFSKNESKPYVSIVGGKYEPYHEQTASIPYTLYAVSVSSGGNVTIDGQQYIADYVDVERKKLVRMVKKNNISFGYVVDSLTDTKMIVSSEILNRKNADSNVICNVGRYSYTIVELDKAGYISWYGPNMNSIAVRVPISMTSNEFNSLGVYVIYELATPTEIDLTDEEVQAFKALSTYYPKTYINAESEQLEAYTMFNYPVSMEKGWEYVKQQIGDTRKYVYDMDLQSAEAYVNSEYAVALTELEV